MAARVPTAGLPHLADWALLCPVGYLGRTFTRTVSVSDLKYKGKRASCTFPRSFIETGEQQSCGPETSRYLLVLTVHKRSLQPVHSAALTDADCNHTCPLEDTAGALISPESPWFQLRNTVALRDTQ